MLLSQSGVRYFADGANDVIPFAGAAGDGPVAILVEGLDGSRVLAISTRRMPRPARWGCSTT